MGQEQSIQILSDLEKKDVQKKLATESKNFQERKKEILQQAVEEERRENIKLLNNIPELQVTETQKKKLISLRTDLLQDFIKKYETIEKECLAVKSQLIDNVISEMKKNQSFEGELKILGRLNKQSREAVKNKIKIEQEIYQEKRKNILK